MEPVYITLENLTQYNNQIKLDVESKINDVVNRLDSISSIISDKDAQILQLLLTVSNYYNIILRLIGDTQELQSIIGNESTE